MIKSIIIEDQTLAQRVVQKYISDTADITLSASFNNALDALNFLQNNTVDIIFLDIHLPKLSGMDFLSLLSTQQPQIILTTGFDHYALQSYEYDVCDYLLKPFSYERFLQAISKARKNMARTQGAVPQEKTSIVVKNGYEFVKIDLNSIIYIKSEGDYTQVQTTEEKYLLTYPLKYWQKHLPANSFCQIHRSYIVNTKHITKATASKVIVGSTSLPIGRLFKPNFFKHYIAHTENK